MMHRNFG